MIAVDTWKASHPLCSAGISGLISRLCIAAYPMIRKTTGIAKAPSTENRYFRMKIRLTSASAQAKHAANSYWFVIGSRPAAIPRSTSAAVSSPSAPA